MPITDVLLSLLAPVLLMALLFIVVRRKLYKQFPVFCVYCFWALCATAIRLAAGNHSVFFFLVYWLIESSYLVLALLAMLSVLRPFTLFAYRRHPWSRFLLLPFLFIVTATALWRAVLAPINRTTPGRFASAIYVFVILMCLAELALSVVALKVRVERPRRYPIVWTRYEFGILMGFGGLTFFNLIAYVALVFALFHLSFGPRLEQFFHSFFPVASVGSAMVWLIAFWKPESPPPGPPSDLGKFQDALQVLQQQLQEQLEVLWEVAKILGIRRRSRHVRTSFADPA